MLFETLRVTGFGHIVQIILMLGFECRPSGVQIVRLVLAIRRVLWPLVTRIGIVK